ncbi:ABC transporter ATP-binding protein [Marinobacter daepoensis]|uniref:ABC transporter ATP-binding protein n=1 Tax=Marinobacter daepoensis TaxID=262077 RepID=UPI001C939D67|nr:ABC transporter ATP-binding protein [Marinobacter daepoensis]MBY6032790.1 ABC transporter ATP-binding protein [Marinobacter daepoensis]
MSTLSANGLIIDIPGRRAGSALNFRVLPGEVWGVLGPNGAGKTTLLHTLAGLQAPRAGGVKLDTLSLRRMNRRALAKKLGLVFQDRQDSFPATVLETALIGRHPWLSLWESEQGEDIARAENALVALDVGPLGHRLISTLSGGERQRVAIATLMTQDPDIWLLDEPTNHLDLHHQVRVMRLLRAQAHQNKAIFMCLHDLNLASRWCSHVLLLYPDGQACWGPTETMMVRPALERLYNQKLIEVTNQEFRLFLPATD